MSSRVLVSAAIQFKKKRNDLDTLAEALKEPSFEPCDTRLISQLEHDEPLTVHDWLTIDWLVSGLSVEGLSPEEVMSGLPSDDYFYPLVLAIGVRQSLENERIDTLLRRKFPRASQTLPALCERIIRRDALTLTDDDAGDLGLLMSRHVDRVFCEEFASFRAWRLATKHNNWQAAASVWRVVLERGAGCLSAEIGLLLGTAEQYRRSGDDHELGDSLSNHLSHPSLLSVARSWSLIGHPTVLLERAMEGSMNGAEHNAIAALQSWIISMRTRRIDIFKTSMFHLAQHANGNGFVAELKALTAFALELSGDRFEAVRVHKEIIQDFPLASSFDWLLDWLRIDPDTDLSLKLHNRLVETPLDEFAYLELGHALWSSDQLAEAIQTFTHLLTGARLRQLGLLELSTRLEQIGRDEQAVRFELELFKESHSSSNRLDILKRCLTWYEESADWRSAATVLKHLYREDGGALKYVLKAKELLGIADDPALLETFLDEIVQMRLDSADEVALILVNWQMSSLNSPEKAAAICRELATRALHLDQVLLEPLAEHLQALEEWGLAAEVLQRLLMNTDVDMKSYQRYGYRLFRIYHDKLEAFDSAQRTLELIKSVDPNTAEYHTALVELTLSREPDSVHLRERLQNAISRVPKGATRAKLLLTLAELEVKSGDLSQANRVRSSALSDVPDDLSLVAQIVSGYVEQGEEQQAFATLLKFELLNQGRVVDREHLEEVRALLPKVSADVMMARMHDFESGEGGLLIVSEVFGHLQAEGVGVDFTGFLRGQSDSVDELTPFIEALLVRYRSDFAKENNFELLSTLSWLDDVFSVSPNDVKPLGESDVDLKTDVSTVPIDLDGPTSFAWFTGHAVFSKLPLHAALIREGRLHLSETILELEPAIIRFFIAFFRSLAEWGGLGFTKWTTGELVVMLETLHRHHAGDEQAPDQDRRQLMKVLSGVDSDGLSSEWMHVAKTARSSITELAEETISKALELGMLYCGSIYTAFEAVQLLDESFQHFHRSSEMFLVEVLPRVVLRNQNLYEELIRGTEG